MAISAENVKKLRDKTGAGIMDCKRALKDAEGDSNRAEEILKELGLAAVAKRAGRATEEGRIFTFVGTNAAGIMELSCETDFVARNVEFVRMGTELVKTAVENSLAEDDAGLAKTITELAATIKENISLRRLRIMKLTDTQLVADYVHGDAGSLGVIVVLESSPSVLKNPAASDLGKDLAMHAAAFRPLYLNKEAVADSYIAEQRKIFTVQAEQLGKPPQVLAGIIQGKINKHLKEICFSEQSFVKDEKQSVAQVLQDSGKDMGDELKLIDYCVFKAGEELV